jgi:hypothetical protein
MIIGIGNQVQDLRRPKGPTTPLDTWYIELENGLGFLELQNTTDLLLQEAAP